MSDRLQRIVLFEKIIQIAPGERVPRHRLISTLLSMDDFNVAEDAIRDAIDAVGMDSPIHRYRVIAKMIRAKQTEGILLEDRLAILRDAENSAKAGISRFPKDKYAYTVYGGVGIAIAEISGDATCLDEALDAMNQAADTILDPDFEDKIRSFERERRSYSN